MDLLFLISQPRAGSTLTQRLLVGHPEIYTVSEPWLMLSPVYATRMFGVKSEYNHQLSQDALQEFFKILPGGELDYWEGVRKMYVFLYSQALQNRSESIFLDKTPRYYYIIDELTKIFPSAKQLLLIRNPIGVLSSIRRTWCASEWSDLKKFKDDLLSAPTLLVNARNNLNSNQKVIHYEMLVSQTNETLSSIFKWLELPLLETDGKGVAADQVRWRFGDQGLVYMSDKPVPARADRWKTDLADPQFWRCAKDYIDVLEEDVLQSLGYSCEEIEMELDVKKPSIFTLWRTKPLSEFLT